MCYGHIQRASKLEGRAGELVPWHLWLIELLLDMLVNFLDAFQFFWLELCQIVFGTWSTGNTINLTAKAEAFLKHLQANKLLLVYMAIVK